MIALKKLVLSKFYAGRVRLSENLLESIVLYYTATDRMRACAWTVCRRTNIAPAPRPPRGDAAAAHPVDLSAE